MVNKKIWLGMLVMVLVLGLMVVGCDDGSKDDDDNEDNTIYSVSILLGSGNTAPKVGRELSTSVKNREGSSVYGVSYQWKRADSQYSTFVNISNATSNRYTPTIDDAGKYLKVEAKNSKTTYPVLSDAVGPVDADKVAKPTADPDSGQIVSGQEITLTSTTTGVTIRYTLDGTTPTSSSNSYSDSKPKITSSCTLKAIATKAGMIDSDVLSVSYTVVAAPSFSSVTSSASIFSGGIYSVAYGNNRFVAGGNGGRFAYSTNGTTWISSTMSEGTSYIVQGITYGTQFVAVGYYGRIDYSSDGTSWTNVTDTTFGSSFINGVAYGSGKYVAVGEDGKMAYSTNGSTWTTVTDSTFGTSAIYGITYAAGKFVAVGASGKMAYSTTGTSWTTVADSQFSTSTIYGITYGGPSGMEKFIAVGGNYIAYSTDGITWSRATSGYYSGGLFSRGLNRIAWGGNKFVIVASAGVMLYSLDGINWGRIDGGIGTGKTQFDTDDLSTIRDIVYGGGRFLAVGSKSNGLLSVASSEMAISNQQ